MKKSLAHSPRHKQAELDLIRDALLEKSRTDSTKKVRGKEIASTLKDILPCVFSVKAKKPRPSSKISMLSNKEITLSTSNHFTFSMLAFNNILISSKSFSSKTGKAVHLFSWL